jgi:hypothetical protein
MPEIAMQIWRFWVHTEQAHEAVAPCLASQFIQGSIYGGPINPYLRVFTLGSWSVPPLQKDIDCQFLGASLVLNDLPMTRVTRS